MLTGGHEFVFLELEKLAKSSQNFAHDAIEQMSEIEKWGYMLKKAPMLNMMPKQLATTPQGDALRAIDKSKLTAHQREALDKSILDQRQREYDLLEARERATTEAERANQLQAIVILKTSSPASATTTHPGPDFSTRIAGVSNPSHSESHQYLQPNWPHPRDVVEIV